MPNSKYKINLTEEEKETLTAIVNKGKHTSKEIARAQVLLLTDRGMKEVEIAQILNICKATVNNTKRRYWQEGMLIVKEKPKSGRPKILDGPMQARLIAIACSKPPEGHIRWTMELLSNEMVQLNVIDSIADNTVWRYLKKTKLNHGYTNNGALVK